MAPRASLPVSLTKSRREMGGDMAAAPKVRLFIDDKEYPKPLRVKLSGRTLEIAADALPAAARIELALFPENGHWVFHYTGKAP